jgi:hypothetical protein
MNPLIPASARTFRPRSGLRLASPGVLITILLVLSGAAGPGASHQDPVSGPGDRPLSKSEGRNIQLLLSNHALLIRHVVHDYEDAHGAGVMTYTWVRDPAAHPWLVDVLRQHVVQMESRLERGARIYQRDPIFQAIFDYADLITLHDEDIPGGILVIETSPEPLVAEVIRLHAEKVDAFLAQGQAALLPPRARAVPGPSTLRP